MKSRQTNFVRIFWIALKTLIAVGAVVIILLRFEIIGAPMINMTFRYSDKKLITQFETEEKKPKIKYLQSQEHPIRYLTLNVQQDLPYVVFIHGAPGSLSDYLAYFKDQKLIDKLNLISIDRPGYGFSDFGNSETSIASQANAIHAVIRKECKSSQILVIGHSYGGPIAVKMAMDHPNDYQAIMLLAPALDPDNEKEIKMAALPKIPIIRWLTPKAIRVAADEKNSHVEELRKIESDYQLIKIPIYHIHGDKDSLVPYDNLSFSKREIDEVLLEPITLKGVDHFLPWSHQDFIVNKILTITSGFSPMYPSY